MGKCRLYGIKLFFLFLLYLLLLPDTWQFIADIGAPAAETVAQSPYDPKPGVTDGMSTGTVVLLTIPAILAMAYICTSWDEAWTPKQIPPKKSKGWMARLLGF